MLIQAGFLLFANAEGRVSMSFTAEFLLKISSRNAQKIVFSSIGQATFAD
jgi:hypothetical protein